MKKTILILVLLVPCIPTIVLAAGEGLKGTPFQNLQQQIDQLRTQLKNIQLTPGPLGPVGPAGPASLDALNGSECTAHDGTLATLVVTTANDGTVTLKCRSTFTKTVFISSEIYSGNLGGTAGADEKCKQLAAAAGLPGSYKAWISSIDSEPFDDFQRSTGDYVRVDGTLVASGWNDLTDGHLLAPINITETGGTLPDYGYVWAATSADGHLPTDAALMTCNSWRTAANYPFYGRIGFSADFGSPMWTNSSSALTCNERCHIYCIEQ